jgi:hypothetical protein
VPGRADGRLQQLGEPVTGPPFFRRVLVGCPVLCVAWRRIRFAGLGLVSSRASGTRCRESARAFCRQASCILENRYPTFQDFELQRIELAR